MRRLLLSGLPVIFALTAGAQDPPAEDISFDPDATYRRGRSYEIKWTPSKTNIINIELFKAGQRVVGEMSYPNNGSYTLRLPIHLEKGKGYQLKFSDPAHPDQSVSTAEFVVRPKFPWYLKAAPVVVVDAVLFIAVSKEKQKQKEARGLTLPNFPPDEP